MYRFQQQGGGCFAPVGELQVIGAAGGGKACWQPQPKQTLLQSAARAGEAELRRTVACPAHSRRACE